MHADRVIEWTFRALIAFGVVAVAVALTMAQNGATSHFAKYRDLVYRACIARNAQIDQNVAREVALADLQERSPDPTFRAEAALHRGFVATQARQIVDCQSLGR